MPALGLLLAALLLAGCGARGSSGRVGPGRAGTPPLVALVEEVAGRRQVQPELVLGVIWIESRFQPDATSPAGAAGLMQLMPGTSRTLARQLGWTDHDPYDPSFNVEAGVLYLRVLLDRFDGDEQLALAAYTAGPGAVGRWRREGRPLPASCVRYADRVLSARDAFARGVLPGPAGEQGQTLATALAREELDGTIIQELIEQGRARHGTALADLPLLEPASDEPASDEPAAQGEAAKRP